MQITQGDMCGVLETIIARTTSMDVMLDIASSAIPDHSGTYQDQLSLLKQKMERATKSASKLYLDMSCDSNMLSIGERYVERY